MSFTNEMKQYTHDFLIGMDPVKGPGRYETLDQTLTSIKENAKIGFAETSVYAIEAMFLSPLTLIVSAAIAPNPVTNGQVLAYFAGGTIAPQAATYIAMRAYQLFGKSESLKRDIRSDHGSIGRLMNKLQPEQAMKRANAHKRFMPYLISSSS